MTTNYDKNVLILSSMFNWRLEVLTLELTRRGDTSPYTEEEIKDIKEYQLSASQQEIHLEVLCPKIKPNGARDSKYYRCLKYLTITRGEVYRLLEYKKDLPVSVEDANFISGVLNIKPQNPKDIQRIAILYTKVLDILLPSQIDMLYKYIEENISNVLSHTLSNRLYAILRFKLNTPTVMAEELIGMVKLQRGLINLFNNNGCIPVELNVDTDKFIRAAHWVPKDLNDFNSTYSLLIEIQKELWESNKINLYAS